MDEAQTRIEIRQCKYLNNNVELGHRLVKPKIVTALGFQTFHTAKGTLTGLELVYMIRKGQTRPFAADSNADQSNALAA